MYIINLELYFVYLSISVLKIPTSVEFTVHNAHLLCINKFVNVYLRLGTMNTILHNALEKIINILNMSNITKYTE